MSNFVLNDQIDMKDNGTLKFDREFRLLGAYQLTGGLIGLGLLSYIILINGWHSLGIILFLLLFFLLYAFSILCSILCFKRHELALQFSYLNQVLQVIAFSITGYTYIFVSGAYLSLCFDFTNGLDFSFGIGLSNVEFRFNKFSNITMLQVNLVAIGILIWIDRLKRKIKAEALQLSIEITGTDQVSRQY